MTRPVDLLRKHGLALLLTAVAAWVLIDETLPAMAEGRAARSERRAAEERVEQARDEVHRSELWLRGVDEDAYLRERLVDDIERSPELTGPSVHKSAGAEEPADDSLAGDEAGDAAGAR